MDATAALSIGVPGIVSADSDIQRQVILYEVLVYGDERSEKDEHGRILVIRQTAGFRVAVKIVRATAGLKLSLFSVALTTRVNASNSELHAEHYGVALLREAPQVGVLNEEGGLDLVLTYLRDCRNALTAPDARIEFQDVSHYLGSEASSEEEEDKAVLFAISCIAEGKTLGESIQINAQNTRLFDHRIVRQVYQDEMILSETAKPSPEVQRKAKRLLDRTWE